MSLWVPDLMCGCWMLNSDFWTRITNLHGYQPSSVVLSTHNSVLSTGKNRLCGFQPSRLVLCVQISDFSPWITSLYLSQPSCVVFGCKRATFGLELQGSVGQRPHLLFLHAKLRLRDLNNKSLWVTAFMRAFWRLLHRNNKSLWVPNITCRFVHAKRRD